MLQLFRAFDHQRMPWKNGGGETAEIAVFPTGAGVTDFEWRVSMARVDSDGPFSLFEGVDRTLLVLDGPGIRLDVDTLPGVELTVNSAPYPFAADRATMAYVLGGPITDLNVMTRRGRWSHTVARLSGKGPIILTADDGMAMVLASAPLTLAGPDWNAQLAPVDAALFDTDAMLSADAGSLPVLIRLYRRHGGV